MDKYISPDSGQYFAFNIWSIESAQAVMDAAVQMNLGIILQTSMKAFELLDKEELRIFVDNYARKKKIRAYLHLDHCRKQDLIYEAVSCGWDSVMVDASDKPLDENISITNDVCRIAKKKAVLVEAEVGQICGREDEVSVIESGIAQMEDIRRFIDNTNTDMLAVAIGTAHGLYKGTPDIHYGLIDSTASITDIPLVVHGGTGLSDETLLRLLSHKSIKKINISTDVKLAYRQGIEEGILAGDMEKEGFNPLKINKKIHDSIQDMAASKLMLLRKDSLM